MPFFEPAFAFYYVVFAVTYTLILGGWLIVASLIITAVYLREWLPAWLAAGLAAFLLYETT